MMGGCFATEKSMTDWKYGRTVMSYA